MDKNWDPKSPSLRSTLVCHADILGFRARTESAIKSGKANEFLLEVKNALDVAYQEMHDAAGFYGANTPNFEMKVFTDNIFVASPIHHLAEDYGEPELGYMLMLFASVQAGLAAKGFFLRGAITAGQHYQDENIVYGEALLEATALDETGKPPRLVIGDSVKPLIKKHLSWYPDSSWAPHHHHLLEDTGDGRLFVNYLTAAFEDFPDEKINYQLLEKHAAKVKEGLQEHGSSTPAGKKYEWVATYHNYVCETLAERYQLPSGWVHSPDGADMWTEAERVLDYLVPLNADAAEQPPRPFVAAQL